MRQSLIDKNDKVYSLRKQCRLLSLNRSGLYYKPVGINERDQVLMNLLDAQYTRTPFWGVRNMTTYLKDVGYKTVGRDHVRTLLRPQSQIKFHSLGQRKFHTLAKKTIFFHPLSLNS